jgi:hypothetical protein
MHSRRHYTGAAKVIANGAAGSFAGSVAFSGQNTGSIPSSHCSWIRQTRL